MNNTGMIRGMENIYMDLAPVSYTHLDVYKRQALLQGGITNIPEFAAKDVPNAAEIYSFHPALKGEKDVYKRQRRAVTASLPRTASSSVSMLSNSTAARSKAGVILSTESLRMRVACLLYTSRCV